MDMIVRHRKVNIDCARAKLRIVRITGWRTVVLQCNEYAPRRFVVIRTENINLTVEIKTSQARPPPTAR